MQTSCYAELRYLQQGYEDESADVMSGFVSAAPREESISTHASEPQTLELMDPLRLQMNNAVQLNRQLHACLQRKEEEISGLKEKNAQLKELVKQAQHYATILTASPQKTSVFVPRPSSAQTTLSHARSADSSQWHFTASEHSWLSSLLTNTEELEMEDGSYAAPFQDGRGRADRVKRQLWPSQGDPSSDTAISSVCTSEASPHRPHNAKRFRSDLPELDSGQSSHQSEQSTSNLLQTTESSPSSTCDLHLQMVQVYGSFQGLQVLTSTGCVNREEEGVCFKTSIREHETVRTKSFPHGKTFTSHSPDGGCRFLWVPNEN